MCEKDVSGSLSHSFSPGLVILEYVSAIREQQKLLMEWKNVVIQYIQVVG